MHEIYDEEITDEQIDKLTVLQEEIAEKVDAYAYVLKKHYHDHIEQLKDKKKEIDSLIKRMEKKKQRIEYNLHNLAIDGPLLGNEFRLVSDFSITRSVDESRLTASDRSYAHFILPPLDFDEVTALAEFVKVVEADYPFGNPFLDSLAQKLEAAQIKYNVTDFPEGHTALIKNIRPTVKVLKA